MGVIDIRKRMNGFERAGFIPLEEEGSMVMVFSESDMPDLTYLYYCARAKYDTTFKGDCSFLKDVNKVRSISIWKNPEMHEKNILLEIVFEMKDESSRSLFLDDNRQIVDPSTEFINDVSTGYDYYTKASVLSIDIMVSKTKIVHFNALENFVSKRDHIILDESLFNLRGKYGSDYAYRLVVHANALKSEKIAKTL